MTRGFDVYKLVKGRKWLVFIDTLDSVLNNCVVPTDESDTATAIAFWDAVAVHHPLFSQVVVAGDSSFAALFADHLRQHYSLVSKSRRIAA